MDRNLLAYLLIGTVAVAIAVIIFHRLFYSRERVYRRRQVREEAVHNALMAKRDLEQR